MCALSHRLKITQTLCTAIALPMGMTSDRVVSPAPSTQDILSNLDHAEELFWADLALTADRGNVPHVREAAVHLALIRALQTSLGNDGKHGPIVAAHLLGKIYALPEKVTPFNFR